MNIKRTGCLLGIPALIFGLIACGNGPTGTPSPTPSAEKDAAPVQTLKAHRTDANSEVAPQEPAGQPSGGSARAIVPYAGLQVDKATAPNSYTVGELFANAAELNKQKVTVKGQVVKISPNIMGRNWIHIQDGSGNPEKNTHDLVITADQMVQKGDIVSFEGTLSADKDFGFGYRYTVIIEDAVVVK
jgi:hypothetical protein